MITVVVIKPDESAYLTKLPDGLDFLEALYDLIDTDFTIDLVHLIPGKLDAWVRATRDDLTQNNKWAASLWQRLGRTEENIYGTIVLTAGLDSQGRIDYFTEDTADQLLQLIHRINANQEQTS